MIKQLVIRNFALIEECTIRFEKGFTAITGETGAGKSMLMGALRTVIGGKPPVSAVRTGEEKAFVEAVFDISENLHAKAVLEAEEMDADDELVVSREILLSGKSRSRINGTVVNLATLERVCETLVQMHGQSDQLLLRDLRIQQKMLDSYCGDSEELSEYASAWNEWTSLKASLKKTEENARALSEQKEFIEFQKNELEKASLRNGEEAELEEKTARAKTGEMRIRAVEELRELFDGENGVQSKFESFRAKVRQLSVKLPEFESLSKRLEDAYDAFSFADDALQKAEEASADLDPRELDRANSRLALIQRLKRKYRTDEAGLVELLFRRKRELESVENLDADLAELEKKIEKSEARLADCARALSEKRKAGKESLDSKVERMLQSLGMPKARFITQLSDDDYTPTGKDRIEFCIAPNVGEGEKPLRLAVSGGELSRVLLAFESVLAELDSIPLLVFDEVDSGISGEVGNRVGEALRNLGKFHQVLSITHLQQVASRAESHLAVEKHENAEGRTVSTVKLLSYEERIVEIARMLGDAKSPTSLAHAKELLEDLKCS
jgi:DNA repair protein RecN (Recombination protein N)